MDPATVTQLARTPVRTRQASEFRPVVIATPPRRSLGVTAWDLEKIRAARNAQLIGSFSLPVALAEAMRTDDALFMAYHARIAPQLAITTRLDPCNGARGEALARRAEQSVFVSKSVLASIHGTMANHGIAIGRNEREVSADGTREDFYLTEWPLEHVRARLTAGIEELITTTSEGQREVITHGDGNWVVFRKFKIKPWTQEACMLPASFVWAAHANGIKDWAGASTSHGLAKMIGELPEGIALVDADGALTPEAQAFLNMIQQVISGEAGAGIRPAGSKTDFAANGSTAWQVFSELINNREKAAARIYLGTDAILGAQGGAPGIDISALFGVASTKIQADFEAIEQAVKTGVYEPWAAINEGSSRYAPGLKYLLPDADADRRAQQQRDRRAELFDAIERYKKNGMTVDQPVIDRLAAEIGVDNPPRLAPAAKQSVPLALAPTDIAKVVRVREARASQGLEPFGDERDDLTISQLEAQSKAPTTAEGAPVQTPAAPAVQPA